MTENNRRKAHKSTKTTFVSKSTAKYVIKKIYGFTSVISTISIFSVFLCAFIGFFLTETTSDNDILLKQITKQLDKGEKIRAIRAVDIHGYGDDTIIVITDNEEITRSKNRVLILERTIYSEYNAGHHLYYIKKEENGQVVSYAAGYLSALGNGEFIVLENSFFSEELNKTGSTEHDFWKFMKYERKDGFCYEKSNRKYESASNAASWYLGEKSSVEMWVDDDGRSLVDDPAYKKILIHSSEANPNEQLEFAFGAPRKNKKEEVPTISQP